MSATDPTSTGTPPTGATGRDYMKSHLDEAGSHLRQAARDSGDALREAASAAGEHLRSGREQVRDDLTSGARAGRAAADELGGVAREQYEDLLEKGHELCDSAAELIRQRPIVAFGGAFAAGWLIAKLARGGNR